MTPKRLAVFRLGYGSKYFLTQGNERKARRNDCFTLGLAFFFSSGRPWDDSGICDLAPWFMCSFADMKDELLGGVVVVLFLGGSRVALVRILVVDTPTNKEFTTRILSPTFPRFWWLTAFSKFLRRPKQT
jgi:hypothetical protein